MPSWGGRRKAFLLTLDLSYAYGGRNEKEKSGKILDGMSAKKKVSRDQFLRAGALSSSVRMDPPSKRGTFLVWTLPTDNKVAGFVVELCRLRRVSHNASQICSVVTRAPRFVGVLDSDLVRFP